MLLRTKGTDIHARKTRIVHEIQRAIGIIPTGAAAIEMPIESRDPAGMGHLEQGAQAGVLGTLVLPEVAVAVAVADTFIERALLEAHLVRLRPDSCPEHPTALRSMHSAWYKAPEGFEVAAIRLRFDHQSASCRHRRPHMKVTGAPSRAVRRRECTQIDVQGMLTPQLELRKPMCRWLMARPVTAPRGVLSAGIRGHVETCGAVSTPTVALRCECSLLEACTRAFPRRICPVRQAYPVSREDRRVAKGRVLRVRRRLLGRGTRLRLGDSYTALLAIRVQFRAAILTEHTAP